MAKTTKGNKKRTAGYPQDDKDVIAQIANFERYSNAKFVNQNKEKELLLNAKHQHNIYNSNKESYKE